MDLIRANKVLTVIVEATKEVDNITELQCIIGTAIDIWCADKNIPDEEALKILEELADAQKGIYRTIGRFEA